MPSIAISSLSIFSLLLFFLSFSQSLADISPSIPVVASTACNTTIYPNFCKSLLPSSRSSNLFDYGRFSVRRSLSTARQFSALVDRYLKHRSSFTNTAIQALEDCQLLSELNVDFLVNAAAALDSGNSLSDKETSYIEALLSAILTNQQTCLDGLQATSSAWRIKNNLATPLSNSTRLYSISLALFTRAWVHTKKRDRLHHGRNLMFSEIEILRDGRLTLRMSDTNRKLFESKSGRKLLQTETGTVFVRDIVTVSKDGSGNFTSINDAVAAAPNKTDISGGYFLIYIQGGVYEEYVSIDKKKKNLMMIGDGINRTVITGNRSIIDGWTTFNSATFAVVGQGFVAINITIRNTAGPAKHQAVALRNGADLSVFYRCSFEAYQDTLYTHSLRQFYRDCDVYGTVDFIFGNAAVVLQNCNINPRLPMQGQTNVVTAQGRTDPNQNTGISIHNCRVTAAADLASSGGSTKTYLGRPWKAYSRTVYIQSFLDGLIEASGWLPWSGDFALTTLYYAEYNNSGPGSGTGSRVAWPGYHVINASDASNFTISNFLLGDNWIPSSRVPFTGGLL
ncbi:pectinesterase-like [Magnolia sinica]|uniref:pectinesterase-like n=1 Tax=Magnolia sinica TaxID=86752 RepID=UPI00265B3EC1|nr:pectinesterase-like [Magnolia sinica]